MFSSSSEQECLSCMGQLSIRIKFNFANSIFSGSSTECGQVGIFGCLLTPCPGGSSRACSCCLPGGRHVYRRSSLAGGSHSSWREFDVHGENVLSGLGRAVYLGWGRGFLRESSCWTAQRADAIQHEYFPPICAAWTALMATWRVVWMTKVCGFLLSPAAGMRPGWGGECYMHCQVMARWHFWTCS